MDTEKVIKGLENCLHYKGHCLDCPYNSPNCQNDVLNDAVTLLKEQEEKMKHLNNITLEYEKEVFRLQTLLKEQEAQRDYEASVEMAEYCERYEQTYNPEDGSM